MHAVLPYLPPDDEQEMPLAVAGLLTHLDAVYRFALALTRDAAAAADLTEDVYARARDGLWETLGGHGLRDRLLAQCVSSFLDRGATPGSEPPSALTGTERRPARLDTLLDGLPWDERAAIALVDQLHSNYAAGAAVLGVDVAEFRALLHRGRWELFTAYRAGAR